MNERLRCAAHQKAEIARDRRMKKILGITLCAALFYAGGAWSADPEAGKAKSRTCAACHGPDGNSQAPDFPKLAGQHPDYIAKALQDYKSGARKNPIMAPMAQPLTTRDIADLAAFYSQQRGLAIKY
jgi:cytochrome c553